MPETCAPISPVAFAVCSASALTSEATTANPRPASPARAASMVAFSANRLVCSAIAVISFTTSPICCAARARLHIGGGLLRRAGGLARQIFGDFGRARQRACRLLELHRRGGNIGHDGA